VRPADFDLAAYWKASTAEFMHTRSRYHATLRLHPRAADRVKAWRMCAPGETGRGPETDGWITLRLHFEDEEQACFVALGFGVNAQVLEPDSLRRRVRDDVHAMSVKTASPSSRAGDRGSDDRA
jgi:predicted DNA-binding transcriptional regulator YafY